MIGQLGTTQKFTSAGNSTTAKTGTITVPSGDRRAMLLFASRGYVNDATSIFPASITVGGQTVSAETAEVESYTTGANSGSILYVADESTIDAMSGGAFTITYDSTLSLAYEISVMVIFLEDVDQTAGVVDSGQLGSDDLYFATRGVELTTTSGDLCFCFGDQKADATANSLYTGMTALDTLTAAAGGDQATKSDQRVDYVVASGAATTCAMTFGDTEIGGAHCVAFTEDEGAGATAPDAPTSLTATKDGSDTIDLSWTAPASDGGSSITGYKIERESPTGNGFSDLVADTGTTATTYEDSGLSPGTQYNYRVSAINAIGTSDPSTADADTTDAVAPGAPTGLTATADGANAIDLSWTAPASTGGAAITGYFIERETGIGNGWSTLVADTSSTGTTYEDSSVDPGTEYNYRVSAINSVGTGDPSTADDATTDAVRTAGTYYLRADGTAVDWETATGPATSAAACMNVSVHNSETFIPGDTIVVSHRGGVFRSQLTVPSSGSDGSPITYEAEDTENLPQFSGADVITTWTEVPAGDEETDGLFSSGIEVGDLTDFDTTNAGGDCEIAASTAEANNGTYSIAMTGDGTSNLVYVQQSFTAIGDGETYYFRFYWKVAAADLQASDYVRMHLRDGGGIRCQINWNTDGSGNLVDVDFNRLPSWGQILNGADISSDFTMGAWNMVEIAYKADSTTGGAQIWINGNSVGSDFTFDTSSGIGIDSFTLGNDASAHGLVDEGVMYFDDIKVDTSPIGAASLGGTADTWSASVSTEPTVVIVDDVVWDQGTDETSLSDHEWYWTSNTLYVRDATGDPDSSGVTIEAAQRGQIVNIASKTWVTLDGLELYGGNEYAVHWDTSSDNCVIENSTVRAMGNDSLNGALNGGSSDNITIDTVTFEDLYKGKAILAWNCEGWTVTGCTMEGVAAELEENFCQFTGDSVHHSDYTVTNNTIDMTPVTATGDCDKHVFNLADYGGTPSPVATGGLVSGNVINCGPSRGGIQIGSSGNSAGDPLLIEKNIVHNLTVEGGAAFTIRGEWNTQDVTFQNNLAFDVTQMFELWDSGNNSDRSNFRFLNNTGWNISEYGARIRSPISGEFANNILWDADVAIAWKNGEVSGEDWTMQNNILGPEGDDVYEHTTLTYSTVAAWESAVSEATDNLSGDPLFADEDGADAEDYQISEGSPAIGAGTDVSLTEDYFGNTVNDPPDIGFYAYPPVTISADMTQGTMRGAHRGIMRGAN